MKFIKFKDSWGDDVVGYLQADKYSMNDNLAITVFGFAKETKSFEPWTTLSVNLRTLCDDKLFYADTNNLGECDLLSVLEKENIIENMSETFQSGWCEYPLYRITDKFSEYIKKENEEVNFDGLI